LRYVYIDGVMVNELLVLEGYANASTFPPDVKYQERFLAAETAAREAEAGLWSACFEQPSTSPGDCDPAYPDVCIPPPPPDLQCADVTFRYFRVLPPDPHNFDGNNDGEGCEAP
jgi:micrococcal nuclease